MSFKFAYKIGHNQALSLAEYVALTDDKNYKLFGGFIYSDKDMELAKTGSLVYKAMILKDLPNELPKKIGFVSLDNDKNIIKILKEKGAKKILLQNKYPNAGHFKYVKEWFIHKKLDTGSIYLHVLEHQDADTWSKVDMSLPAKDMKRGIINLKLALAMYNLISSKTEHVCDPFAGLGRNAIAIWGKDKSFYLSDIDSICQKEIQTNIDWMQTNFPSESKLVSLTTQDAQKLVVPTTEQFVISTEGYLTTVLDDYISEQDAEARLDEVKKFWITTLANWSMITNLEEIVFCMPYYIIKRERFRIQPNSILPDAYELVGEPIYYDRAKSRVGHQIVHLKRK